MAGGLNELARAAPDDRRAAAELLAVRVAQEVVVDARAEVIRALDPLQDVAEEDEVDPVVRVEAERRDGPGAVELLGSDGPGSARPGRAAPLVL